MRSSLSLSIPTCALVACTALQAQEMKLNAVVDLWYTQMLDNNLRLDSPAKYYQLNGAFQENGFSIRRSEIYVAGKIDDALSFNVMLEPNTATSTTSPTILQDAFITWKALPSLAIKAGQFKPLQTYEGSLVSSSEVLFYDRSQMGKLFGDKRDRGLVATWSWGKPEGFSGKVNIGAFNGSSDKDNGKANDANAQKDFVTRFEFAYGKTHKFGLYTRHGSTDAADKGALSVYPFAYAGSSAPTSAEILDNKDKTRNLGIYYAFENARWIAQVESITGLLGRRFPSVGASATPQPVASRQYLDQKFLGYVLTGGVKTGAHTFLVRYDVLDYNQGTKFYGPYNPYTQNTTTGAALGADYTPRFTEITAGWNYTWTPAKWALANVKLDYIHRSKNMLIPRAGQTGEQGGDSLVAALQIGF